MEERPNEFAENIGAEWEPQDSKLLKKIIAMMEYAYQILRNYPKAERFSMAADIKRCMDTMLELAVEADNKHYKKTTLRDLDIANKKLKKYILLSYRLRFIAMKQYNYWTQLTSEIGRMIGGRIEEAKNTKDS